MSNKLKIDLKKETISFGGTKAKKKTIKKDDVYYINNPGRVVLDTLCGIFFGIFILILGLILMANSWLMLIIGIFFVIFLITYLYQSGRKHIASSIIGVLFVPFAIFGSCLVMFSGL